MDAVTSAVTSSSRTLGVVGGLGPLASAEFVKTVYECGLGEREQEAPAVLLYSDPSFPDRTQALLAGDCDTTLAKLVGALGWLRGSGASRTVICCVTIHHLLPRLPAELRAHVVSLVDVVVDEVASSRRRHLMLCTTGARELGVFQSHERWPEVAERVVWPDAPDQQFVHQELIYQVKKNRDPEELLPHLTRLLAKYEASSFVAGCTEIHLLAKRVCDPKRGRLGCVDPLALIAGRVARGEL